MIRIGLIGTGRIGKLHARNIARNDRAALHAVYDLSEESARAMAEQYGATRLSSAHELISREDIDAVFICSSTDTHVKLITESTNAGKAIFCEKPIDLDIDRVAACLRELKQTPVPFTIGFHRRYDPHHRALRDAVAEGTIGDIEQIRIVSRDPIPPSIEYIRRSGGIFRDMMIHDLDQCRFLLGKPVSRVFALGQSLFDPAIGEAGDYDTATAMLWTEDGIVINVLNSRHCAYGFDQRIEIFGSKGSLAMDNVPLNQTRLADGRGFATASLPRHFPERYDVAYQLQLEAFLDALEAGHPPETTADDGYYSLQLANAADQSARNGEPVTIG